MWPVISLRISALVGCVFALVTSAAADVPRSTAEQVKRLSRLYEQVEEQLGRSTVYARTEEADGERTTTRAWCNGIGDLVKVAIERSDATGREVSEFVSIDFDLAQDGLLVVSRQETATPNGGTEVTESRKYYGRVWSRRNGWESMGNGLLLRELRKSARFKPGEPLDMSKVAAVEVRLSAASQFPDDEAGRLAASQIFEEPPAAAARLASETEPEVDPFAGVEGDSERLRLIEASASPDGRYGIAVGFEQPVDWSQYRDDYFKDDEVYTPEQAEGLRNYVVELATRRIIGGTGAEFVGTRRRYNHRECILTWADDSSAFVQLHTAKWGYDSCFAGRIGPGPKLIGAVDLGKAAETYATTFLKSRGREVRGSISLSVEEVKPDGTILLDVIDEGTSVPHKGEIFNRLKLMFRLRETRKGVDVSPVSARRVSNK